jgi:diketogulonate reductase-like aldo/keto reductase
MKLTIESKLTLNDGHLMPQLGLGVWQTRAGATCEAAVLAALEAGYRHIDTAALYGNEKSVGAAIRRSGIPRQEIFVTTKLWNSDHSNPECALDSSLRKLKFDYVDLYLIHYPVRERRQSWRTLEALQARGKARSIGVSNFTIRHAPDRAPRRDEDGSRGEPGRVSPLFVSAGFVGFLCREGHSARSL